MEESEESFYVPVRFPKTIANQIDELVVQKESNRSQIIREATKKGLPLMK